MNITVEMTVDEYDEYRSYQVKKEFLEKKAWDRYHKLREKHEKLCNDVLNAVAPEKENGLDVGIYEVMDNDCMDSAVKEAREWFV